MDRTVRLDAIQAQHPCIPSPGIALKLCLRNP